MATLQKAPQTVSHPGRVKQNYRSMSGSDVVVAIIGFIVMVTAFELWGSLEAIGVVIVFGLLLRRTQFCRLYKLPGLKLRNLFYRWCLHGVLWQAKHSWTDIFRPRKPLFLQLGLLPGTRVGKETALIHNSYKDIDSIGITGQGSPMPTLSYDGQVELTNTFAEIDKHLAFAAGKLTAGKSLVFRRSPTNMAEIGAMTDNTYNGNVLYPRYKYTSAAELTDEDRRYANLFALMEEGVGTIDDWTGNVLMSMMISLKQSGLLKTASKKGLGDKEADRLLVIDLAQVAIEGLKRSRVAEPTVMDLITAHAAVHNTWDVVDNHDYDTWRVSGPSVEAITASNALFPKERIVVHRDYCQIDNSFHTVFKLTGSLEDIPVFHMRRLLSTAISFVSVALVGEAVKSTGEYAILDRALAFIPYIQDFLGVTQQGPKQLARENRLKAQRQEVFDSQYVVRYQVYVSVSSDSLAGLEADANVMRQRLDDLSLSNVRIRDDSLQIRALLCATLGSNLL